VRVGLVYGTYLDELAIIFVKGSESLWYANSK
jgi:hypothetical protein